VATIGDPEVKTLLDKPNHAVVSTVNEDGTIHSTVAWVNVESGRPAVKPKFRELGRSWGCRRACLSFGVGVVTGY